VNDDRIAAKHDSANANANADDPAAFEPIIGLEGLEALVKRLFQILP